MHSLSLIKQPRRVKTNRTSSCNNFDNFPRTRRKEMLVLTRKQDETIRIGDSIVVKVIYAGRGKAKIGIEAPANVRVLRGELLTALTRLPEIPAEEVAKS